MTDGVGAARKVGLVINEFANLAGAADFLISVADAMARTAGDREILLIYSRPPARWLPSGLCRLARHAAKAVLQRRGPVILPADPDPSALAQRLVASGLPELQLHVAPYGAAALDRVCRTERIDVLMPLGSAPSPSLRVPWVGYIFDMQHRFYPAFFTSRMRRARDRQFTTVLRQASTVVVNARQVEADARAFYSPFGATIFPLPFSAAPDPRWYNRDVREVRRCYGIGKRYFLISNQFWVHKRHDVAFDAFAGLAAQHGEVELVCTGATEDFRDPDYFGRLTAAIRNAGLEHRIHILGLIPKLDQIALMRGCLAVVQPTAFEGGPGGGSVFDAVALGVRSIVSDIPVNREIEGLVTAYFPLNDAAALTDAMEAVLAAPPAAPADQHVMMAAGTRRRLAMGEVLWAAADHAMRAAGCDTGSTGSAKPLGG